MFAVDVWGFDDSAVAVLQNMKVQSTAEVKTTSSLERFAILLKGGANEEEEESVMAATADKNAAELIKMIKVCGR